MAYVKSLSEERRKRVIEAVGEVMREIERIKNSKVRRLLRTVANFCYRVGGITEFEGDEEFGSYVIRCKFEDEGGFVAFSHRGRGGHAGIYTERDITEFKIPDEWMVHLASGGIRVRGFIFTVRKSLTEETYDVEFNVLY